MGFLAWLLKNGVGMALGIFGDSAVVPYGLAGRAELGIAAAVLVGLVGWRSFSISPAPFSAPRVFFAYVYP